MKTENPKQLDQISQITISVIVRVMLLVFLLSWAFNIVQPFISPMIWAVVIAVAIYPAYLQLKARLGDKDKTTSVIFTLLMLTVLLTPAIQLATSVTDSFSILNEKWSSGTLEIPPPNDKVKDWPVIGEKTHALWLAASQNLQATLVEHQEQVKKVASSLFSTIKGAGFGVLQFAVSIIIAGVLLSNAPACASFSNTLLIRVAGKKGEGFTHLASQTISSVAKGVIGVALIQSIMAGIGLYLLGIPGAGLLALLILIVAIIQLPPILILGPVCVYAFSEYSATAATIFTVWSVIVSLSDAFLKPMLLGRGLSIPMPVILIGAIGGMISSGIIGLFIGPVILALSYELVIAWIYFDADKEANDKDTSPSGS